MQTIPYKLVELRKHSNLSQAYVAKVLAIDSIDYMAYENGRVALSEDLAEKLAVLYQVSPSHLLDDETEFDFDMLPKVEIDPTIPIEVIKEKTSFIDVIKKNKALKIGLVVGVFFALAFTVGKLWPHPSPNPTVSLKRDPNHLINANSNGYIYFSGNNLAFNGYNKDNLLDVESHENVVEILMNEEVTALLKKDGQLELIGKNKLAYAEKTPISIVEAKIGDHMILARTNQDELLCYSSMGSCPTETIGKVSQFFVLGDDYLIVDQSGNVYASDDSYRQKISAIDKVKQIVKNDNTLAVLYVDGSVAIIYAKDASFYRAYDFEGVSKLVLLDDALIALTESKEILIATSSKEYDEATSWGVIDIAGSKDYLVGYDGNKIVGVGNNANNKFDKEDKQEQVKLEAPSNIQAVIGDKNVSIVFDSVTNADYYLITIGESLEFRVISARASIDVDRLIDGQTYIVKIQAFSNNKKFTASDIVEYSFVYQAVEPIDTPEVSVIPSIVPTDSPTPSPSDDPDETVSPSPDITESPSTSQKPE